MRRLAAVLVIAVAVGGCGKDDEDEKKKASATGTASTGVSTTPTGAASTKGSPATGSTSTAAAAPGSPGAAGSSAGPPGTSGGRPVGFVPAGAGTAADREAIVRTLRVYLQAISRANGSLACAQLTPEGRLALERRLARIAPETAGTPCEGSITLYQGGYGRAIRDPVITGVQIAGTRARAVGPLRQVATLVKRGQLWLIANYGQ